MWTWPFRHDSVDPLIARFTMFMDGISQELGYGLWGLDLDCHDVRVLGDIVWRVSHQVARSPSPPPPPYSLFDLTSPTDNFALNYHPMPMLPPPTLLSIEDSTKSAYSNKRKRTTGSASDDNERQRKRARQQWLLENPVMRYDLRPRITEIA